MLIALVAIVVISFCMIGILCWYFIKLFKNYTEVLQSVTVHYVNSVKELNATNLKFQEQLRAEVVSTFTNFYDRVVPKRTERTEADLKDTEEVVKKIMIGDLTQSQDDELVVSEREF